MPLTPEQLHVYSEITALTAPFYTVQNQNDFQRNLAFGRRTTGSAGPAAAISTSARTAWCISARSSADTQGSR